MRALRSPITLVALAAAAVLAAAGLAAAGEPAAAIDAEAAFAKLKALEGDWVASAPGEAGDQTADHEIRVSAAGTVVMETMMVGTDHEMINMYHLDGDDLVVTHYCAGGNQPKMRLDLAKATATELPFVFAGGSNLETTDHHIHDAMLTLREDGTVVSKWISVSGDAEEGQAIEFVLRRAEG